MLGPFGPIQQPVFAPILQSQICTAIPQTDIIPVEREGREREREVFSIRSM